MTNIELAQAIIDKFTPFAFKCECKGQHPDCGETLRTDGAAHAQADTVRRIAEFIKNQ